MSEGSKHIRSGSSPSADSPLASIEPDGPPSAEQVTGALSTIRDRLDYETASLFVPGSGDKGWNLAARVGPTRPWHVVLDPDLITELTSRGSYANARSIPGVGLRLSGLGCGSVSVHPVPGGGVLVLDSAFARDDRAPDDIDAATLTLLASSGVGEPSAESTGHEDDLEMLSRVADTMRRTLDVPGSAIASLLTTIREVVRAERVLLVAESSDHVTRVYGTIESPAPVEAPSTIDAILRVLPPSDPIPDDNARRIAIALGISGDAFRAAYCRQDGGRELLLCAFGGPPMVATGTLKLIARIAGGTRVALDTRRDAIEEHLLPERSRWAHDIHDGITQVVTAAVIQLENLRHTIVADPEAATAAIEESQAEIRNTLAELRAIMSDLSEEGVVPARKPLEDHLDDIVQRWRLPARISVDRGVQDVPRPVLAVALIVIREALTNAAKHSAATNVSVRVATQAERLKLTVHDNGRGFEPLAMERATGRLNFGIRMMRQRVAEIGGTIQINSTPNTGTKVIASLPVGRTDDERTTPGADR